ncbi:MAG: lysostaphin resistance A-like protein [Culicoidibacterales bacterium]
MKGIRRGLSGICLLFVVVSYYIFFFTSMFNVQFRHFAYILGGNNSDLGNYVTLSRISTKALESTFSNDMFQHFYTTVSQQIQFGPYMNFIVYVITFLVVVPLFLISVLLLRYRNTQGSFEKEKEYFLLFRTQFFNYLFTAFMLSGFGSICSSVLSTLTSSSLTSANQAAIQSNLNSNFIISIVPIVILAPIIEEIVFRGVLLSGINAFLKHFFAFSTTKKIKLYKDIQFQYSEIIAILGSSILFALIHLSTNWSQWVYFPAYFCGGLALGGIYVWNKERIYASMITHSVYNGLPIVLTAIMRLIMKG